MGQKKLWRFEQIKGFKNVFQYPENVKGTWAAYFNNNHPVILELACGKGEYAVGLGRLHPENNYIGIDLKGNRIYVGARKALEEGLDNVAFIRSQIDKIDNYFNPGEISEIWITFPDPQLRTSKAGKRLTHPRFLRIYQNIIRPSGAVHLKTDSPLLYDFTLMVCDFYKIKIETYTDDAYAQIEVPEELKIQTHYEKLDIAKSNKIHYIKMILPKERIPDNDKELKRLIEERERAINT